ncbi:4Fe-4S binding protein [Sulfurovum sp. ST-21]|uniref:4Fe-4S binding protein n=1 Tax=Sulfurovum indicum TaxID=2779528 RepID=A0A7M1S6X1_9BACT|nr:4Fe-4S binding protein [Sulfurovum indicum]QOR62731.1 4Fe-4S binding protein [Sulfurovum indicum]
MVTEHHRAVNDLFRYRLFRFIFTNKQFVFAVRITVAALFFYAIYLGFSEPGKKNTFTHALFWGLFWPFFIVTTLPLFGRIFCGICPHGFLGKYITKIGLKHKMPKWLQNRFIGVALLVFGWWGVYYMFPSLYRTPYGSAMLFAIMTLVAFVFYFLFREMSYCTYICPIGTALRGYGKLSATWFGSYDTACSDCKTFDCAKSCPYGLSPFNFKKKKSMSDCTLCMDCTDSCAALKFKVLKPGYAIYQKFKVIKAEVWVFILILAAIPISMAFHHGLGRSNVADEMLWAKTATFAKQYIDFGSIDAVGLFAFVYAVIFSVFFAVLGMFLASVIMKQKFSTVFYTLGYAFAPLFLLASMAHAWEFFLTGNSARIIEGFAWGFGMQVDVEPFVKHGNKWLEVLHLFRWIAVVWALYILYHRMQFINAAKVRKVLAYPFAALLIFFFIAVNIYREYILDTYGRKPHHSHSIQHKVKAEDLQPATKHQFHTRSGG